MSLDEFHQHVQQFLQDEKALKELSRATGVVGTVGHTQASFDYEMWLEAERHRQRYNITPEECLAMMASLFGSIFLLFLIIYLEPYLRHRTPKQNRRDCLRFIGFAFFVLFDLAVIVFFQHAFDIIQNLPLEMMFYA